MSTASMRFPARFRWAREINWGRTAVWLICFSLVAYLGMKGGGYDPLVHDQAGIAIWWLLLVSVAVGALPRQPPARIAWAALALFAAFTAWTALSLTWTESVERTGADLARVTGYLGILAFAVFAAARSELRHLAGAVAAAVVLIASVALLSRFHPSWFAGATETASLLENNRERLSYPLHYWNGLAALIAIGLPPLFHAAAGARSLLLRAAATAALPLLALTIFFTLSRGGIAAAAIALGVYLAFDSDRLARLPTLLIAAIASLALVLAADARDALQHGALSASAESQGDAMLAITVVVCALAGAARLALGIVTRDRTRPGWMVVSRRRALAGLTVTAAVLLVAALAVGAPGRASDAWAEFKEAGSPGKGADRLTSAAGQHRYQLWSAAVRQSEERPLAGTGSGTFEYWWARTGDVDETVRDAHSLYFQTLGELGIVGLALLLALVGVVVGGGAWIALGATGGARSAAAAALAGCVGFFVSAVSDWTWQLPVLPVAMLLLAGFLVMAGPPPGPDRRGLPPWPRLGAIAVAVVAIVVIAIPLASTTLIRESEREYREGDLVAALDHARGAQNVEPGAASPWLQEALVLEAAGRFGAAVGAAATATEKESTNWRTWLVLARVEAQDGDAAASVRAYNRARELNPRSPIFN